MKACIYCKQNKPSSDFNREHVVPAALGSFKNHPTFKCVCKDCNQQLGDKLVSPFLRDSVEGLMRYGVGQKKVTRDESSQHLFGRLNPKRFTVEVELPPKLTKLKWEFRGFSEPWLVSVMHPPQIGLWPKTRLELPVFFDNSDLAAKRFDPARFVCDEKNPALAVLPKEGDITLLVETVETLGLPLPFVEKVEIGEHICKVVFGLDNTGCRFLAYVAFNFLALELGADFVEPKDFDPVRAFIRYGHGDGNVFVSRREEPLLWNDNPRTRRIMLHQIALDWGRSGRDIVSVVCLYGTMFHNVLLCRNYSGLYRDDLRRGRGFDWVSGKSLEMRPATLMIPRLWKE